MAITYGEIDAVDELHWRSSCTTHRSCWCGSSGSPGSSMGRWVYAAVQEELTRSFCLRQIDQGRVSRMALPFLCYEGDYLATRGISLKIKRGEDTAGPSENLRNDLYEGLTTRHLLFSLPVLWEVSFHQLFSNQPHGSRKAVAGLMSRAGALQLPGSWPRRPRVFSQRASRWQKSQRCRSTAARSIPGALSASRKESTGPAC